jgi:hypothetical protein
MGGSELMHIIDLSIGGSISMKTGTIPGSDSLFDISDRIALEMRPIPERLSTAGRETYEE